MSTAVTPIPQDTNTTTNTLLSFPDFTQVSGMTSSSSDSEENDFYKGGIIHNIHDDDDSNSEQDSNEGGELDVSLSSIFFDRLSADPGSISADDEGYDSEEEEIAELLRQCESPRLKLDLGAQRDASTATLAAGSLLISTTSIATSPKSPSEPPPPSLMLSAERVKDLAKLSALTVSDSSECSSSQAGLPHTWVRPKLCRGSDDEKSLSFCGDESDDSDVRCDWHSDVPGVITDEDEDDMDHDSRFSGMNLPQFNYLSSGGVTEDTINGCSPRLITNMNSPLTKPISAMTPRGMTKGKMDISTTTTTTMRRSPAMKSKSGDFSLATAGSIDLTVIDDDDHTDDDCYYKFDCTTIDDGIVVCGDPSSESEQSDYGNFLTESMKMAGLAIDVSSDEDEITAEVLQLNSPMNMNGMPRSKSICDVDGFHYLMPLSPSTTAPETTSTISTSSTVITSESTSLCSTRSIRSSSNSSRDSLSSAGMTSLISPTASSTSCSVFDYKKADSDAEESYDSDYDCPGFDERSWRLYRSEMVATVSRKFEACIIRRIG